jgi:hypothetical protein
VINFDIGLESQVALESSHGDGKFPMDLVWS